MMGALLDEMALWNDEVANKSIEIAVTFKSDYFKYKMTRQSRSMFVENLLSFFKV